MEIGVSKKSGIVNVTEYFDDKFSAHCESHGRTMKDRGLDTRIRIKDENNNVILDELHNVTALGGSLFMAETIFGLEPNRTQRILLNSTGMVGNPSEELAIPHQTDVFTSSLSRERTVNYFMIGNGAEDHQHAYDYYEAQRYETRLYNSVPFRTVLRSNDLTQEERARYRFRIPVTINNEQYYSYYAKQIDDIDVVNVEFNESAYQPVRSDSDPIDANPDHNMVGGEFRVFTIITLSVNDIEFKEWWRLKNNGSLRNARLSELGLVLGLDAPNSGINELAGAELFAKLTHEPYPMSREGSRRTVEYIIYT